MRRTGSSGYYGVLRIMTTIQSIVKLKIPVDTAQDQEQLIPCRGLTLPLAHKKHIELNSKNLAHLHNFHFPSTKN